MRGLDPRINLFEGWITGSSPVMTSCDKAIAFNPLHKPLVYHLPIDSESAVMRVAVALRLLSSQVACRVE
jgi:hypothetical protein